MSQSQVPSGLHGFPLSHFCGNASRLTAVNIGSSIAAVRQFVGVAVRFSPSVAAASLFGQSILESLLGCFGFFPRSAFSLAAQYIIGGYLFAFLL